MSEEKHPFINQCFPFFKTHGFSDEGWHITCTECGRRYILNIEESVEP